MTPFDLETVFRRVRELFVKPPLLPTPRYVPLPVAEIYNVPRTWRLAVFGRRSGGYQYRVQFPLDIQDEPVDPDTVIWLDAGTDCSGVYADIETALNEGRLDPAWAKLVKSYD